jgi:glucokinase
MGKTNPRNQYVIALDLGGTKLAAGIVTDTYEITARQYLPTQADKGVESVVEQIISAITWLCDYQAVDCSCLSVISIAACGSVDMRRGIIVFSPNLPGWRNIPLVDLVQERLGVRVTLINDANAAALGEYHLGAGRGIVNLLYLSLGTGIGGAIIIDGNLYTGASGGAGETGHMTINTEGPICSCGNRGCLETLASGTAITREAVERLKCGERSSLTEVVGGDLKGITAEKVALAASRGDPLASDVIHQAAYYLGMGMVNLVNLLNPDIIVVGGGVADMGELLLGPARKLVREKAFPGLADVVSIVRGQLGDDAGILGAAVFAHRQSQDEEECYEGS